MFDGDTAFVLTLQSGFLGDRSHAGDGIRGRRGVWRVSGDHVRIYTGTRIEGQILRSAFPEDAVGTRLRRKYVLASVLVVRADRMVEALITERFVGVHARLL